MKRSNKKISSKEFDKKFDEGEDVSLYLETSKAKINRDIQRINIDFPTVFLKKIDREAKKIGVARTALIKLWLADRLERQMSTQK